MNQTVENQRLVSTVYNVFFVLLFAAFVDHREQCNKFLSIGVQLLAWFFLHPVAVMLLSENFGTFSTILLARCREAWMQFESL